MARLTRKNNKLFCGNAQQSDVGQFGSLNAGTKLETTDIDTIQSLSAWGDGWQAATLGDNCYPTRQERNGLDYVQSYLLNYLYQEGIPEWSANTIYYKGSIVKLINGTNITLYQSLVDNNTAALSDTNSWKEWNFANSDLSNLSADGEAKLNRSLRNIGEVVISSIPLNDAGLHLLDGALIDGSGIYSAFVDYIAGIYDASASYFCTEAQWQTSVATYGVCEKFVYDNVNNTVRLPKYSNKIYTKGITSTAPVVGNGIALGFTDGTINNGVVRYNSSDALLFNTSAFGKTVGKSTSGSGNINPDKAIGLTTNSTKSGLVAQLSKITTSLDGYYYIVIATSTKTDIQVDIDEVVTDLNGKADVYLTNTSPTSAFATALNTAGIRTVVKTYVSGTSWYRVWSDGWIEQGGLTGQGNYIPISFLKPFSNTNYTLTTGTYNETNDNAPGSNTSAIANVSKSSRKMTKDGFTLIGWSSGYNTSWYACGY